MFNRLTPLEKEWNQLLKRERLLIEKMEKAQEPFWEKKLKKAVPDALQETLEAAFYKSFKLIFSRGGGVLEKTYSKERLEAEFKTLDYAQRIYHTRKNLSAVKRSAVKRSVLSVAGASAEGAALGLLGIGLPDIAIFLGMLLRTLYTLELSYGIDYNEETEKELLLELLALSLCRGDKLRGRDAEINRKLYYLEHGKSETAGRRSEEPPVPEGAKTGEPPVSAEAKLEKSIRKASEALAGELLYMKFLQGIPVIGVLGGLYDGVYMKKITAYVSLKLERRYLLSKMEEV